MFLRAMPLVLLALLCSSWRSHAQVIISEILPDPQGVDDGAELIELHNPTASAVDLSRWALYIENRPTFGQHAYTFDVNRVLQPGAYLTVHWLAAGAGDVDDVYTSSEGGWYAGGNEFIDNAEFAFSLWEDDNDRWVGPDFADPAKMRHFGQVGDDASAREWYAEQAGLWNVNDVIVDRGEGISMVYDGTGESSMDWFGDVRGFQQGPNGLGTRPAFTYGLACAGSGGFSPTIMDADQIPADPNTRFQISLINGLGPAAFMVVGYQQANLRFSRDCTLWVSFDELIGPFFMTGIPGQGEGRILLDATNPLPNSDFEVNFTFFCQDGSAHKGLTLSNALSLRL